MDRVHNVSWFEIADAVREFVAVWNEPDAVVGISRGGAPLATAISYAAPIVPVAYVSRVAARGNNDPFYIFSEKTGVRDARNEREFRIPELPGSPRRVLIVDDVATFGGTLEVVTKLLLAQHPNIECEYYCYAVDRERLSERRPNIAALANSHVNIDNSKVWLKMPWKITM